MFKSVRFIFFAVVDKFDSHYVAVFLELVVLVKFLDYYLERIAVSQICRKVDVPREYIRYIECQ